MIKPSQLKEYGRFYRSFLLSKTNKIEGENAVSPMQMNIFAILTVLLIASLPGLIPAFIARSKGRNFFLWWLYGFGPVFFVAVIHALLLKPNDRKLLSEGMKKCPLCAEIIRPEATVCRYCGRDIPV